MAHHTRLTTEHIGISSTELTAELIAVYICMYITINTFTKKRKGLKKVLKRV